MHMHSWINKQKDRQMNKQTDRQLDRRAGRAVMIPFQVKNNKGIKIELCIVCFRLYTWTGCHIILARATVTAVLK